MAGNMGHFSDLQATSRTEGGLQQKPAKIRPPSYNHRGVSSATNLNDVGSGFFPSGAPGGNAAQSVL